MLAGLPTKCTRLLHKLPGLMHALLRKCLQRVNLLDKEIRWKILQEPRILENVHHLTNVCIKQQQPAFWKCHQQHTVCRRYRSTG